HRCRRPCGPARPLRPRARRPGNRNRSHSTACGDLLRRVPPAEGTPHILPRGGFTYPGADMSGSERADPTTPLLSVVVPTHNVRPWLRQLLESVLRQTDDLEVLVVDDRSTD